MRKIKRWVWKRNKTKSVVAEPSQGGCIEMRSLNSSYSYSYYCISIIFGILLITTSCFIQNKPVFARRMIYMHNGVYTPPSQLYKLLWDEYMQRSCANEYGLYSKAVRLGAATSPTQLSHQLLSTLPARLEEEEEDAVLNCFRKYYHVIKCLHKHACTSLAALLFHHTNIIPRRSLADTSPTDSDDTIIIPTDLLQPPRPPPEADQASSSSTNSTTKPQQQDNNNNLDKLVILISATVAGLAMMFAVLVFCSLIKGVKHPDDHTTDCRTSTSTDTSAESSRIQDENEFGRNRTGNELSQLTPSQPSNSSLTTIPENGMEDDADTQKSQTLSSGSSAPPPAPAPAPPPAPPFKPKAPPPPPKVTRPPPAPPLGGVGPRGSSTLGDGSEVSGDNDGTRTKLKPFFWDKVVNNSDQSMVWDEIRDGSFQFNEKAIESLFGYNPNDKGSLDRRGQIADASQPQQIQIIDPKKSQNLSILLRALNVTTEEVRDALLEGNELPPELLHTILRMAPTQEEELKLRLFDGNMSLLGPAERFLKEMVNIPLAFKRMESLMFMMTYKEEVSNIKESFVTLEVACDELKNCRLFLKLLEAVLKTGNRMNDGTYRGGAQAFKLDTLLKLSDVKGTDGKTTLLHFVVQEIVRSEGKKAVLSAKENQSSTSSPKSDEDFVEDPDSDEAEQYQTHGLEIVSGISSELGNVKKAAMVDADGLTTIVSKLGQSLTKIKNFLNNEMDGVEEEETTGFYKTMLSFRDHSEGEVEWLLKEEQRISELVRKTADYFHGNSGREEGLRLFSIVRDFLVMLDRICAQLKQSSSILKPTVRNTDNCDKNGSPKRPSHESQAASIRDMRQRLFPTTSDSDSN